MRRPQDWPIQPLAGEPPLTLFRGKQLTQLPEGTEVDRYGEPNGNLTYAVGTPFDRRSLVPDWINRPYRAYRVVRPTEALTGSAIPWFDQPGGGTAFVLSKSIAELLDKGVLEEIPDRQPPARN
ncbi:TNT domain-containing protein [Actinokineospora soli]|uniref:TNT domain-containing protein n=1 Tax=Actinokineospora soli TaxID=1048753 RepID=A0ABW2TVC0_9PSEU